MAAVVPLRAPSAPSGLEAVEGVGPAAEDPAAVGPARAGLVARSVRHVPVVAEADPAAHGPVGAEAVAGPRRREGLRGLGGGDFAARVLSRERGSSCLSSPSCIKTSLTDSLIRSHVSI